jgi:hypothetical protein
MSSKLKAGTATSGAVIDADTTGILEFQSGSTPTTAVTIDTAQNVGIGTSSPTAKIQVSRSGGSAGSGNLVYVDVTSSFGGISINSTANNNTFIELLEAGTKVGGFNADTTNNVTAVQAAGGHALAFNTNNTTERMRISSSGGVYINQITETFAGKLGVTSAENAGAFQTTSTTADAFCAAVFARSGNNGRVCEFNYSTATLVGSISVTASATAYNTSSDYRLKENIAPMTDALAKVAQLKPVTYKWKVDGSNGQGFIAHELAEVVPDCVTGEKDAVDEEGNPKYQGIDTSFLVATLTSAIQELNAKVDAQAAEIQALKGVA